MMPATTPPVVTQAQAAVALDATLKLALNINDGAHDAIVSSLLTQHAEALANTVPPEMADFFRVSDALVAMRESAGEAVPTSVFAHRLRELDLVQLMLKRYVAAGAAQPQQQVAPQPAWDPTTVGIMTRATAYKLTAEVKRLLHECGLHARASFNIDKVEQNCIDALIRSSTTLAATPNASYVLSHRMLAGGATQLGKTFLIFVTACFFTALGVPSLIVIPNSETVADVLDKLNEYASMLPSKYCSKFEFSVFSKAKRDRERVIKALVNGHGLVVPYTYAQLDGVREVLNDPLVHSAVRGQGRQFMHAAICDEADETVASKGMLESTKAQRLREADAWFGGIGVRSPILKVEVSGTLVPNVLSALEDSVPAIVDGGGGGHQRSPNPPPTVSVIPKVGLVPWLVEHDHLQVQRLRRGDVLGRRERAPHALQQLHQQTHGARAQ